jgi:hypothetical protein
MPEVDMLKMADDLAALRIKLLGNTSSEEQALLAEAAGLCRRVHEYERVRHELWAIFQEQDKEQGT